MNQEEFAKIMLTEIARLTAELACTRSRLYGLLEWVRYPLVEQMEKADGDYIRNSVKQSTSEWCHACELPVKPTPSGESPPPF